MHRESEQSVKLSPSLLIITSAKELKGKSGNTKGGSITVPFISCLTGLDRSVFQLKTNIVSCQTADSKPVKLEVNSTVILPPLVFPVNTRKSL